MSRLEGGYEHLATKADVESVRVDLERLRAETTAEIGSVRGEIERVRAEIKEAKISTILWLTGIMGALTAAQVGAVVTLFRTFSG